MSQSRMQNSIHSAYSDSVRLQLANRLPRRVGRRVKLLMTAGDKGQKKEESRNGEGRKDGSSSLGFVGWVWVLRFGRYVITI